MSFLGAPFRHDVFISYSHGDFDGSGESNLKKWSQAFARELESELRPHPKFRELRVFLDQHHRPDQGVDPLAPLTKQLRMEIEATGLLTILMSPHYLGSRWCADERDWWLECQKKNDLNPENRIAVARVWPTEEDWPHELVDRLGFTFYDEAVVDYRTRPFQWPDPTGAPPGKFRDVLVEMAGRILKRLEEFKQELDQRRRAQANAAKLGAVSGQVIYLHARATHERHWTQAKHGLDREKFVVFPTEPDPLMRDPKKIRDIAEYRVETLSACDALLLLGTDDGRALEADLVVVGRQDRHSARARSERLLPCAVLDFVGSELAHPSRVAMARALDIDWIDTSRSTWPSQVRNWLNEAAAVAEHV